MSQYFQEHNSFRKHFGKFTGKTAISPLCEYYKRSYDDFLQVSENPLNRKDSGLESLLRRVFPLEVKKQSHGKEHSTTGTPREVYFYSHYFLNPSEWTEEECKMKGISYFSSIHIVTLKMELPSEGHFDLQAFQKEKKKQNAFQWMEKHIFVLPIKGIPMMTQQGSFLINGIERALLAQLQRCPGIYANHNEEFLSVKVIPYYGANLQFELGKSNKIFVRLMGKRRISLPLFLHALGFTPAEILSLFFSPLQLRKSAFKNVFHHREEPCLRISSNVKRFLYGFVTEDIYDKESGQLRLAAGTKIDEKVFLKILSSQISNHPLEKDQISSLAYYSPALFGEKKLLKVDPQQYALLEQNLFFCRKYKEVPQAFLNLFGTSQDSSGIHQTQYAYTFADHLLSQNVFFLGQNVALWKKRFLDSFYELPSDTLSSFSKMIHILRGSPHSHPACTEKERLELMRRMFLDPVHFNLSNFGRLQLNETLELPSDCHHASLSKVDLLSCVQFLLKQIYHPHEETESLYQLQNRKVRLPGELLGYILLKSFLQIKRRKEFSSRFYPKAYFPSVSSETLHDFPQKELLPLPSSLQKYIYDGFVLKGLQSYQGKRNKIRWVANRSFFFSDHSDKLTVFFLPAVKKHVDSFLTGSNLSQLLDQLNPLSECTHLRRLSLLGPDGLNKDNVSLDTRDVQSSFFGRICPIETPEGKAVGIVNSMTVSSFVDHYGDLLTPYLVVRDGIVQSEVHYLSPKKETSYVIAMLEEPLSPNMQLKNDLIYCRHQQQFVYVEKQHVNYIDASSKQMLSLSSSLIPFLEHNDGNRALMGSNMQRQAVPSLVKEVPLIGTGSEELLANQQFRREEEHSIAWIDNFSFFFTGGEKSFRGSLPLWKESFLKYEKANQKSYKHETPRLGVAEKFYEVQKAKNFTGTELGQISIGHNIFIGFMSMNGYSFEDSIVISDRLLKDSFYSSLHTKEFLVFDWTANTQNLRMTKDLPHVDVKETAFLDEEGVIQSGSPLFGGDLLVGKVMSKSKARRNVTEKERFLQGLLLGEQKEFVRDVSERAPMDFEGHVLDVKRFYTVPGEEISSRGQKQKIQELYQSYFIRSILLEHFFFMKIFDLVQKEFPTEKNPLLHLSFPALIKEMDGLWQEEGTKKKKWRGVRNLVLSFAAHRPLSWVMQLLQTNPMNQSKVFTQTLRRWIMTFMVLRKELRLSWYKKHLSLLSKSLRSSSSKGSLKMIKVTVGYKHKLKPGDKMTGRHGNKGVICQVLPLQDMPYTADGTSLDIVLNPIGISSRMNLGQVFEVHLGFAAAEIAKKVRSLLRLHSEDSRYLDLRSYLYHFYGNTKEQKIISKLNSSQMMDLWNRLSRGLTMATSSFSGARDQDVKDLLQWANQDLSGQMNVFDGRTGEMFDRKITAGYMYVLKLNHLVDDKIHARFTGPYNRITEQPLGGKSLHGGQRFGEMEVWALQAYGAAYTLLDMITVKSDSRLSRMEMRSSEKLPRMKKMPSSRKNFPEAFHVLLRELWCLGFLLKVY